MIHSITKVLILMLMMNALNFCYYRISQAKVFYPSLGLIHNRKLLEAVVDIGARSSIILEQLT
jgi:hypothetical protein